MNRSHYFLLIVVLLLIVSGRAGAGTVPVDSISLQPDSTMIVPSSYSMNMVGIAARAMLSLLAVFVLIFVTVLLLKKIAFKQRIPAGFADNVMLLGSIPVAAKKNIQLVKMVDRILVLAVTESSVTLLTEIDDVHVLQTLEPSVAEASTQITPFRHYLQNMLRKSNES